MYENLNKRKQSTFLDMNSQSKGVNVTKFVYTFNIIPRGKKIPAVF